MYKKILVPLDGSKLAECVLPHVESIAGGCGVQEIVFLRVVEPYQMPTGEGGTVFSEADIKRINSENKAAAENYLARIASQTKYKEAKAQTKVLTGKASEDIAAYAAKNGVDLITISTHGRSGVSRWVLGSVADRVLRSASVPVLMVRAPGCKPGI